MVRSPFVEKLHARGYEVLLLDQPMDEYVLQQLRTYESVTSFFCRFCLARQSDLGLLQWTDLPGRHEEGPQVWRRG
jgi:HSP90 family molecular chaperone